MRPIALAGEPSDRRSSEGSGRDGPDSFPRQAQGFESGQLVLPSPGVSSSGFSVPGPAGPALYGAAAKGNRQEEANISLATRRQEKAEALAELVAVTAHSVERRSRAPWRCTVISD